MSSALPTFGTDCCSSPCETGSTVGPPGPQGEQGDPGENGTNGVSSFTTLTANFIMPASAATVAIAVADSSWMSVGQPLFIEGAGIMEVVTIGSSTSVTVSNPGYPENTTPTQSVASGGQVTAGGWRGTDGADGTDASSPITTQGDLIVGDAGGDPERLAIGTDGQFPQSNGTDLQYEKVLVKNLGPDVGRIPIDYLLFREEQVSGASPVPPDLTSGAWQTRNLNTEVFDTGGHGTVASSQITLLPGTYRFRGGALAYNVDQHQSRLQNISDATTIIYGQTAYAGSSDNGSTESTLCGRFTITQAKTFELQHRCATTNGNGRGLAGAFGNNEVYSWLELEREAL